MDISVLLPIYTSAGASGMRMRCDVVVVGLGPAGAHFSYLASNLGYKVVALEKGDILRPKTCAGGISPLSVSILKECYKTLPSEIMERKIDGINLATKTHKYSLKLPEIEAFTTRRLNFDRWLAEKAMEKGTVVKEQCNLKKVCFSKESVHVEISEQGSDLEIRADCMIGAYGATSFVPRIAGICAPETVTGVQCELELPEEKVEEMFGNTLGFFYDSRFSRFGYAWIFPKKNSIAVGLLDKNPKHLVKRLEFFARTNSAVSQLIDDFGEARKRIKAALLPNETLEKTYKNRCILVGDAAGFGDRITWEGISYALRSADCAMKVFDSAYQMNDFSSHVLGEYQRLCDSAFGKDMQYGKKLQNLMFDNDLDSTWSKVMDFLNKNEDFATFLMNEMQKHMSLATALMRLRRKEKMLLLKHIGYRKAFALLVRGAIRLG